MRQSNLELSDIALSVLHKRYLIKNDEGEVIEEPIELFRRVAKAIAEGEYKFQFRANPDMTKDEQFGYWQGKFLDLMTSRKFMPNTPTLMNAGREIGQLSACFVLPIEDSLESIYKTLRDQAIIHQSGGGTGFSFSRLRPKGDIVKSTMGVSSGPVSFLAIYDASTDKIKQGGSRRGANMGILRVDHPDIEEFVTCKKDNDQINNFNISVGITDEFMEAVEKELPFWLTNPRTGEATRAIDARELWAQICKGAWLNGEPGIVFLDEMNRRNPTPQFPIESTNPCSEAHLPPYDVCNLGSINVAQFYGRANGDHGVDWAALKDAIHTAVRFLDNVIEQNKYPLPEIEEMAKGNRRIGLGIMGFADLLIKLGIRYDSEEGFEFGERLMQLFEIEARLASADLARERGNFPNWEESAFGPGGKFTGDVPGGLPMRNATVTTIAPTGTISMIAGCSGGIEPLFAVAFKRFQADMYMNDVNPEFERVVWELWPEGDPNDAIRQDILDKVSEEGDLSRFGDSAIPKNIRYVWRTAGEISSEDHIKMQAAFQKNTSMGISKTINMPHDATVEDVKRAYELAHRLGCTGTAVYRDGSRDAQVLSTGKTGANKEATPEETSTMVGQLQERTLAEARNGRPRSLSGCTKKITTGHGPMYVTMNDDEFGPRECFIILGKPGGTAAAFADALGRMISLAETHGATADMIIEQLRGIQDGHPVGFGPNAILSVPDGIAKAMADHYGLDEALPQAKPVVGACPECSGSLTQESGCTICHSCGFSRCV